MHANRLFGLGRPAAMSAAAVIWLVAGCGGAQNDPESDEAGATNAAGPGDTGESTVFYPQSDGTADYESSGKHGVMRLECAIGSFILEGEGRVEMTFRGGLLLHNFQGTAKVTGDVREEFQGMGRRAWFGTGKAVLEGKWRKVQWFGGDLKAVWYGWGYANLFGEYDPVTKGSGIVKIDDLDEKPWYTTGTQHYVPKEHDPAWEHIKKQLEAEAAGGSQPSGPAG
ncbi:MAG: hypothetical protein IH851_05955 [Armatimonadetes bacterium]|nr:hypothetical protein [Armatimonadota bacterium]